MKLFIIGGDGRNEQMAEGLACAGHTVMTAGLSKKAAPCSISEGILWADAVICGLPFSKDGKTVFAPMAEAPISVESVLEALRPGMLFIGGKLGEATKRALDARKVESVDYLEIEAANLLNAIPTAEGAIEIAMRELPITIWEAECLVVGFGRIGKYLGRLLSAMGGHVTVAARKMQDFALCRTLGYKAMHTGSLGEEELPFRILFNTVPHCVITDAALAKLPKNCLLIDLASAPGGIDVQSAEKRGIKCITALSLPGKVAPETAGKILCGAVEHILRERN